MDTPRCALPAADPPGPVLDRLDADEFLGTETALHAAALQSQPDAYSHKHHTGDRPAGG